MKGSTSFLCNLVKRESNGSPQGKSNNSPFVVSLRQILAIATLATKQEHFPVSDGILLHLNKTFYYAAENE